MSDRILRIALCAFLLVGLVDACSEQVGSSAGCPALCADESGTLFDTVLTGAIVTDSSLGGYPMLGETRDFTLLNYSDSADVRVVVRYDTLPKNYTTTAGTSALISEVDSAQMIIVVDTLAPKPIYPFTIQAYDVDTTAADTIYSALLPLFRPSRLIGTQTYLNGDLKADTLRLKLDGTKIYPKIRDSLHLRVGLKIVGVNGSVGLKIRGSAFSPRLRFRVSTDTTIKADTALVTSSTPTDEGSIQQQLVLYPVIAAGALPPPTTGIIGVGGVAGTRTYFKFNIPSILIDSVQVLRASLLLTQVPSRSTTRVKDSVTVYTQPVLAAPTVTDLRTIFSFIGSGVAYGVDSVRFSPRDSGQKSIELVNLFRFWRSVGTTNASRALVIRANEEGETAAEADFFSLEGPVALRPRLQITYVPHRGFGLP